ncbi:MAG: HNH endonuclease [Actinomycetota bacterium]|nr:HNH endonuclease [Actinomycetota bacterium]
MSISTPLASPGPGQPVPGDGFGRALAAVDTGLDQLADATVWSLDDARVEARLGQALHAKARLDESIARLVGQVDDRDLARQAGASSTRAHLIATHRLSAGAAAGLVSQARSMSDRTSLTRRAWAAGLVNAEQAVVIGAAIDKLSAHVSDDGAAAGQANLVAKAQTRTHTQLQILANHLVEVVDPDNADQILAEQLEAEEARALQQTTFRGRKGADGTARFSGKLPNLQYDMLKIALEAIASPRRNHHDSNGHDGDGAAIATAVTGPAGTQQTQLPYGQRLGRAFCELIEHLPTDQLPQHGVTNATLVVTIDSDKLACGVREATLATGGSISAGEARRLACNAGLLPLMLDGESRILDLGRAKRCFDRYQRIALAVRDQGCVFPGCDRPPAWCEAHHPKAWKDAGPTDLSNGCLLCSFHHHLVHQGQWAVVMATDGVPDIVPPARVDPRQHPLRHERFKRRRRE